MRYNKPMAGSDLTLSDLKHLAKLASLSVPDEKLALLAPQLSEILNYVSQLQALDLKDIPQTAQVTGLVNVNQPDEVRPGLTQEQALSQTTHTKSGYFVVPGIFKTTDDA